MIAMLRRAAVLAAIIAVVSACSPEVGSEEWCAEMKDKPKGDWTVNQAQDFTKHCVF